MKKILMIFIIGSQFVSGLAFARNFSCECKVQRNSGDTAVASGTWNAPDQQSAEYSSRQSCKETASQKMGFVTAFSDIQLVYHHCTAGGGGSFQ